jgi:hypothetical protein
MPREGQIRGFEVSKDAVKSGYFRDCYNPHGLFWNLGLSWWTTYDKYKLKESEGVMSTNQIPAFKNEVVKAWENAREEVRNDKEYIDWYDLLMKFLDLAMSVKSGVIFSV